MEVWGPGGFQVVRWPSGGSARLVVVYTNLVWRLERGTVAKSPASAAGQGYCGRVPVTLAARGICSGDSGPYSDPLPDRRFPGSIPRAGPSLYRTSFSFKNSLVMFKIEPVNPYKHSIVSDYLRLPQIIF